MGEVSWFIAIGFILILLALTSSRISRLPLSSSIVCLLIGIALGSSWIGLLQVDLIRDASFVEELSEIAILVSLFAVGLQLRFAEVSLVILTGSLLQLEMFSWKVAIAVAAILLVIRPIAAYLTLLGDPIPSKCIDCSPALHAALCSNDFTRPPTYDLTTTSS